MHYANGREAKNGDRIMVIPGYDYSKPIVGILHDAVAGNDACNGAVAIPSPSAAPTCCLSDCLHIDDVKAAIGDIRQVKDTSKQSEG